MASRQWFSDCVLHIIGVFAQEPVSIIKIPIHNHTVGMMAMCFVQDGQDNIGCSKLSLYPEQSSDRGGGELVDCSVGGPRPLGTSQDSGYARSFESVGSSIGIHWESGKPIGSRSRIAGSICN